MDASTPAKLRSSLFYLKVIGGIGLLIAAASVYFVITRNNKLSSSAKSNVSFQQLIEADGKNGRACWVAVDRVVYDLSNSLNWENGQHTTSEGAAYCGADMSQVIDKAPHGRKMLDQLAVVGQLAAN